MTQATPPKQNVTDQEVKNPRAHRANKGIIILSADKRNVMDIMTTIARWNIYLETYAETTRDPTTYSRHDHASLRHDRRKKQNNGEKSACTQKLYELPNIDKGDILLRPILSALVSPTQNLAAFLEEYF